MCLRMERKMTTMKTIPNGADLQGAPGEWYTFVAPSNIQPSVKIEHSFYGTCQRCCKDKRDLFLCRKRGWWQVVDDYICDPCLKVVLGDNYDEYCAQRSLLSNRKEHTIPE